MKKVGIITLTGEFNYGNKLQNYAMQQVLEYHGLKPETIRIDTKSYAEIILKTYVQKCIYIFLPAIRKKCVRRTLKFLAFNRCISQAKGYIDIRSQDTEIREKLGNYDYLIYGSDQIWNPEFKSFSELYLGKYAEKEKNIAVSASIGITEIPTEYRCIFKEGLSRFKKISVREENAREKLERLDEDIRIDTLIDPVLMLGVDEWRKVEKEVRGIPSGHSIVCFLGKDTENEKEICDEKFKNAAVNIGRLTNNGPGEFLYLMRTAGRVITDSFHAAVFALIFGKELYIVERRDQYSSMSSRIETLLEKTGVKWESSDSLIHIECGALYQDVPQAKMNKEQEKFHQFIEDACI